MRTNFKERAAFSTLAFALGFSFVLAIGVGITALLALVICTLWEVFAPHLSFIPAQYHTLEFMMIWAGIMLVAVVRGIVFGR